MKSLLVHHAAHDVPVELPRQVRCIPLFDLLLEFLLVLHALHVLHVLVPRVDALLRLKLHRLSLTLIEILLLALLVLVVVVVGVLLLGDVVDERARAGPLLLFLLAPALFFLVVLVLLLFGAKKGWGAGRSENARKCDREAGSDLGGAEVFARSLRRDDVYTPGETNGDECDHAHRLG